MGYNGGVNMTPKQKTFVAEYLANGLNATKAAISAGYSAKTANEQGSRLLAHVSVAAAIAKAQSKRLEKLEVTADRVIQELAKMGFANMHDYMTIGSDGQPDIDLSNLTRDQAAAIQEFTVDSTGGSGDGERRLVLRNKFKLADKRGALELLARHLKLLTDKVEISTSAELIERLMAGRKRAAERGR